MEKITREELSRCDGRSGRPAYIAFRGVVYDVSQSYHWRGGRHWALHEAGTDLTGAINAAPHEADFLTGRYPAVGELTDS